MLTLTDQDHAHFYFPLFLLLHSIPSVHAENKGGIAEFSSTDNHCKDPNSRASAVTMQGGGNMGLHAMDTAANVGMHDVCIEA